jgi:hypothetical protein
VPTLGAGAGGGGISNRASGGGDGGNGGAKPGWDKSEIHEDYDWTFTSPYRGSLDAGVDAASPSTSAAVAWEDTDERVDRGMLMERDPILFFDEMTLYESELDDNGEMSMSLKVRVMPRCWYVLLRFWMRVDGVLIRLRETRFFCRMTPPPTLPPGLSEEKRAALGVSTFHHVILQLKLGSIDDSQYGPCN